MQSHPFLSLLRCSKFTVLTPILYCVLVGIYPAFSQQSKMDSLTSRLQQTLHDSDKVNIFNALASELKSSNPDTAILLSTQALDLARKAAFEIGIGNSYNNLGWFYYEKGNYDTALTFYNHALDIEKRLFPPSGGLKWAAIIVKIGIVYFEQNDYPKALDHYLKALEVNKNLGNKSGVADVLGEIGMVYYEQSDYTKALDHYLQALEINKELGNKKEIASWLGEIGMVYHSQGDNTKALDHYRQALEMNKELGNKSGIAFIMGNIANVYNEQDDYANALKHFRQALEIHKELRSMRGESAVLANIGNVYNNQGDYQKALEHYQKALEINKKLEKKGLVSACLANIGAIYSKQGNYADAINHYSKALEVSEEIGDKVGVALCISNIGNVYRYQGDYAKAIDHFRKSLELNNEIGNKSGVASCLSNIGLIYKNQSDYITAINHFIQALEIKKELGEKSGIAGGLGSIGTVYSIIGDYAKGIDYFRQALEISKDIGNKADISVFLGNLGGVYCQQGEYVKGLDHLLQSLEIDKELGNKSGISVSLGNIGIAYTALGELEQSPKRRDSLFNLAMEQCRNALNIAEEIGVKPAIATNLVSIAKLYIIKNKPLVAIPLLDTAISMFLSLGELLDLNDACLIRSSADSALGNWQSACRYFLLHVAYKDSATGTEMQKEVGRTGKRWELRSVEKEREAKEEEKKRQEAVAVSKRNQLQYTVIVAVTAALLSIIFLALFRFAKFIPVAGMHYIPVFTPLIIIETVMLFADPYIEQFTAGATFLKALVYFGIAVSFMPVQRWLERWVNQCRDVLNAFRNSSLHGTRPVIILFLFLFFGCDMFSPQPTDHVSHSGSITTDSTSADFSFNDPVIHRSHVSFTKIMSRDKAAFDAQFAIAGKTGNSNDYLVAYNMLKPWSHSADSVNHYTMALKVGIANAEGEYKLARFLEQLRVQEEAKIAAERKKMRDIASYTGLILLILIGFGVVLFISRTAVKPRTAEILLLLTFFMLFETMMVYSDTLIDFYSGGEPVYKIIFSTLLAALLAVLHEKAGRRMGRLLK